MLKPWLVAGVGCSGADAGGAASPLREPLLGRADRLGALVGVQEDRERREGDGHVVLDAQAADTSTPQGDGAEEAAARDPVPDDQHDAVLHELPDGVDLLEEGEGADDQQDDREQAEGLLVGDLDVAGGGVGGRGAGRRVARVLAGVDGLSHDVTPFRVVGQRPG